MTTIIIISMALYSIYVFKKKDDEILELRQKLLKRYDLGFKEGYGINLLQSKKIEQKIFEEYEKHQKICYLKCDCDQEIAIRATAFKRM